MSRIPTLTGASDLEMSVNPLDNPSNVETVSVSDVVGSAEDFALDSSLQWQRY